MAPDQSMILDRAVMDNPYPFYDALRETAPVWKASRDDIYVVTDFDLLEEAARRITDFSSVMNAFLYRGEDGCLTKMAVNLGSPTLAVADPPVHTLHKQMIFPKFVAKRMALIEAELAAYTETCIDRAQEMGEFDFMTEIGLAVPIRAIAMLIGFLDRDDRLLSKTALQLEGVVAGTMTLEEMGKIQLDQNEIRAWLKEQVDRREGGETEHLLDAVKTAVSSGKLNEEEAMTTMMTLLSAGGGSTSALLGNMVRILAENPDMRRTLQADPSLAPAFIEEAGRLESPFRHHLRSVPQDTTLGDVEIPAGSSVMLMWGAANRDPKKFDDPNAIKLDRRPQHVIFGKGIHQCVGSALARMEARIVLTALLRRNAFPILSDPERPVWENSLMVRRHEHLPMAWAS